MRDKKKGRRGDRFPKEKGCNAVWELETRKKSEEAGCIDKVEE